MSVPRKAAWQRRLRTNLPPTGEPSTDASEPAVPEEALSSAAVVAEPETPSDASAAEPSKTCQQVLHESPLRPCLMPDETASGSEWELYIAEAPPTAAASAAEPGDEMLLRRADLAGLQQRGQDRISLHQQARDFLNAKIRDFSLHQEGLVQSQPVDPFEWPTWKEYIATLDAAEQIIGTKGIIAVHIEQIEGVSDPNRGGKRRVDIVLYNADGQFFRVHPGSKRANDAQIRQANCSSIGASEPNARSSCAAEPRVTKTGSIESASRQYHDPPLVLTQDVAEQIPQNHLMGRAEMFGKLQSLSKDYPLELTQATIDDFPWWLWIPNTGRVRDKVIGSGIERIALMQTSTDGHTGAITSARFLIVHTDQTALLLDAYHDPGSRTPYSIEILVPDSSKYKWWVNWKP